MKTRFGGLCAALGLVPFLGAVCASLAGTQPRDVAPPGARPPLAFDQYAVNLREVAPRPVIQAHFDFTNRGDEPVRITKLDASCGCLAPQLVGERDTYEPGERGRFHVRVRTASEPPGPHVYTVRVNYEDSRPHAETVTFRLTLPERKLSVEPSELVFYPPPGRSESKVIYVTDYRRESIDVVDARCELEFVALDVLPAETDQHGRRRFPIQVTVPADYPPGRHMGVITLRTSDPEFTRLFAGILVQGQSGIQPVGFDAGQGPD